MELYEELNYAFMQDPRVKELNPMTKFAGHIMTAMIDYAKEKDISTMTLDDIFEYCYTLQKGSL